MTMKQLPWLLVTAVGLYALISVSHRGQDQNWDFLNYHYFAGYAVLHGRFTTDLAPSHLQSFLNPLPNILAYLALSSLPFPARAWVLTGVQLLALPLLVLICREIGRDTTWKVSCNLLNLRKQFTEGFFRAIFV